MKDSLKTGSTLIVIGLLLFVAGGASVNPVSICGVVMEFGGIYLIIRYRFQFRQQKKLIVPMISLAIMALMLVAYFSVFKIIH